MHAVPTPCFQLCTEQNLNTNMSPYMDKELLYNHSLCIDGTAITKDLEFSYSHPQVTKELLIAQVQFVEEQGCFPKGFLKC